MSGRWRTSMVAAVLATGLVVGSAVSADEPPTTETVTTDTVTTDTITTDSATTVTSEESVETKSGNSSTSSSSTSTSTTTTAPPTTTTIPALSDVATAGSTSGRSMSVESPGQVLVPAERSGPSLQLTEPPEAPTTTTLPPLSQLPENSGEGRRIVYSKTNQWVWLVEADGRVAKHHPVSGNRQWNLPQAGTYQVSSKSQYTCSIVQPSLCWRFMVRFARGPNATWRDNIGFHEIPTNTNTGNLIQGDGQLGQPLSAGCVRQSPHDAFILWEWTPVGTTVVVLP